MYYLEKARTLAYKCFNRSVDGVVYTNSCRPLAAYQALVFEFNYPLLMHLGDQLYFKPLIKKLADNGYPVAVIPTVGLQFLFQPQQGSRFVDSLPPDQILVISRLELLPWIKRSWPKSDYFLYDTTSTDIQKPIANAVLDHFSNYFGLTHLINSQITSQDYLDFTRQSNDKFQLGKYPRVVAFSNYVDSGGFRLRKADRQVLLDSLRIERGRSYIVHLGTSRDAQQDLNDYRDVVDLDLRGHTTPAEVYDLLALPNLAAVYCHDTFIMHLANILGKQIKVKFKRYGYRSDQKRQVFGRLFVGVECPNLEFL